MTAPTLHTARLILRPYVMADFPAYAGFVTSDRTQHMGGPHDAATAWAWFCNDTAQWALLNMGGLIVTLDGKAIGQVALCHGPAFPEPELGWFLYDGHEGHGYVTEAATALRDWAYGPRDLKTFVSYINTDNTNSAAVATRLGAQIDPVAVTPAGMVTQVWRYNRGAA